MKRQVVHLVNGDHAARAIERAGLGEVGIIWRDVLHDGPVREIEAEALAHERAAFIGRVRWGEQETASSAFVERDRRLLDALASEAELVLWFAPGLHDQLQRLQVLARAARFAGGRPRVSEAALVAQAGTLSDGALQAAFAQRSSTRPAAIARAADAWLAFTSDDAGRLDALLSGSDADSPLLDAAIRRWREEFPAVIGGLSRTERNVLDALGRGVFRTREVYLASCHHAEDITFCADLPFAAILCRLSAGELPLLAHPDQRPVTMPDPASDSRVFWNDSLLITRAGRERLAGVGDWMLHAPPRWMGGVALHGSAGWRWDAGANRMRCMPAR